MDITKCYPNKFLATADLDEDTAVTIEEVSLEELDGKKKPVVWFREYKKGMVLNKTNANTIVGLYGNETEDWVGRRIVLRPTETEFKGEMKACIRVSLRAPRDQSDEDDTAQNSTESRPARRASLMPQEDVDPPPRRATGSRMNRR